MSSEAKWCEHCQKDTHNDAECWSTRMMPPTRPTSICTIPLSTKPTLLTLAILAALANFKDK